jgi:hypothetical protein
MCCGVLHFLTLLPANRVKARDAHTVSAVLACMRSRMADIAIQRVGCEALRTIVEDVVLNKDEACAAGAAAVIVRAMQTYRGVAEETRAGLNTLIELCNAHVGNCIAALDAGAVEVAVDALRMHATHGPVVAGACNICKTVEKTLNNSSDMAHENTRLAQQLVAAGALKTLVAPLQADVEKRAIVSGIICLLVQFICCDTTGVTTANGWRLRNGVRAARAGWAALLRDAVPRLDLRFNNNTKHRMMALTDALDSVPLRRACRDGCGATDAPELKACGRCRAVHYCSVACQRAAWATHRQSCAPPPKKGAVDIED